MRVNSIAARAMTRRQALLIAGTALTATHLCSAADLRLSIVGHSGKPIPEVVFVALPTGEGGTSRTRSQTSAPGAPAILDQINKEFVPEVLVVRVGTSVLFPNSDSVAHQVYSFSPAKRFALPLYRGRPYPPVVFDKAGTVTVGCNIHDQMVGYVVVTDAPYFGQASADGQAVLKIPAQGTYRVSAWHPRFSESVAEQTVAIADAEVAVDFRLTKAMQVRRSPTPDRRIRDY